MAGIGFIIFGAFVSLFGYVLITCATVGSQNSNIRALAEIIRVKQLSHLEEAENFFEITVRYIMNGVPFTSSFIAHSLDLYPQNKKIEVFCNPENPGHIISKNQHSSILPLFIAITILGTISLLIGILITIFA
ncbi:MAG: hypothetical protein Q4G58_17960 [bacterium]|nr:hypothetical protein [bacterium]